MQRADYKHIAPTIQGVSLFCMMRCLPSKVSFQPTPPTRWPIQLANRLSQPTNLKILLQPINQFKAVVDWMIDNPSNSPRTLFETLRLPFKAVSVDNSSSQKWLVSFRSNSQRMIISSYTETNVAKTLDERNLSTSTLPFFKLPNYLSLTPFIVERSRDIATVKYSSTIATTYRVAS